MMEISPYYSRKIAILNAVAIMLVLLLHSYFLEAADYPVAQSIQSFTGTTGLSGVAVPLFYFISGLLFFKSIGSLKDCLKGIRKRVYSLLIPYVLWNIIFVGWYVVLHFTPSVSQFVNSNILSHFSCSEPLSSLEFLLVEPVGFHLWFLRDLMVYVAFTPLLWLLLKRYPWITLVGLYGIFGAVSRCGITYFAVGGIIASHYSLEDFNRWLSKSVVLVCGLLFLSNAVITTLPGCNCLTGSPYWQQGANTIGILTVWGLYDVVYTKGGHGKLSELFVYVSKYSFFIYLFHEPAFNIIKKLSLKIIGTSNLSLIVLYWVNPLVMVAISFALGMFIKKHTPKFYAILVGGR